MVLRTALTFSCMTVLIGACSSSSNGGTEGSWSQGSGGLGNNGASLGGSGYGGDGNNAGNGNDAGNANNAGSGNSAANGNDGGNGGSSGGNGVATGGEWGNGGGSSVCQPTTSQGKQLPPVILFQVDITNSMTRTTATTGNQTKWQATQAALTAVLPQLPQDWLVGITFFNKPGPQNIGCYDGTAFTTVPPAPLAQNLSAINNAINGITLQANVDTWTPTLQAWQYAFNYIVGGWPNSADYAQSHRYIVFMTDGVPTVNRDGCTTGTSCTNACVSLSEYDYFIQTIGDAGAPNGIQTFFMGVPGSEEAQGAPYEPRTMLSQLAFAGGTAPQGSTAQSCAAATTGNYCHIDLTTASNFGTALQNAVQYTVGNNIAKSCSFNVPTPPSDRYYVDLAHTVVNYTSVSATQTLTPASSAACTDGDFYTDDPNTATKLTLCPTLCDQLNADANAEVTVTFSCTPIG